jgi:hypothetical protein
MCSKYNIINFQNTNIKIQTFKSAACLLKSGGLTLREITTP